MGYWTDFVELRWSFIAKSIVRAVGDNCDELKSMPLVKGGNTTLAVLRRLPADGDIGGDVY